ncbi:MAG: 7-cyano-7-deazaguanine synthase QueC [Thermodesulfobacteriota bacterium]|nr:7-cyano-7-deazaguanine synthase QueC [Thermodesulfobacteriota bacterium]
MDEKRDLAVVLISGGMDSCTVAAIVNRDYNMAFLHVKYGQRTEAKESKAFFDIAEFYKVERKFVVDISYLKAIGGSCLTDIEKEIPDAKLNGKDVPITYVPFRNTHLLAIAVSWAEVIGAGRIFIGAVEEDSSGYPDCRQIFFDAFNNLVKMGTRPQTFITVETPLIGMKKGEIVKKGIELGAPLHLTWSCYKENEYACGICDSCVLRLKGFKEAGIKDEIQYLT